MGIGCGLYYWLTNPAWSALRVSIYLGTSIISGAVLAGLVMYFLQAAIAKTGVFDRFESGRTQGMVWPVSVERIPYTDTVSRGFSCITAGP